MSQAGIMGVKGGGSAIVETLTGNSGGAVGPTGNNINIVGTGAVTVTGNPGTSTLTISDSGAVAILFDTDSGTATPSAGVITFNAVSQAGSTVVFSGAGSTVSLNTTDAGGNTFVALGAGNPSLTIGTAIGNSGFGGSALSSITTGQFNNAFGNCLPKLTTGSHNCCYGVDSAADAMTSGSYNCAYGNGSLANSNSSNNVAIGYEALTEVTSGGSNIGIGFQVGTDISVPSGLTTGSNNILIGIQAGFVYTGAESSNIILGSNAGTTSESHVLRIGGGTGTSTNEQSTCFISGVNGNTVSNAKIVTIDTATDQLGTMTVPSGDISITGDTGGTLTSNAFTFDAVSQAGSSVSFSGSGTTISLNTTDSNSNTMIGKGAGNSSISGIGNVGIGSFSAADLTSGDSNVSIGYLALSTLTSANNNVAVGISALFTTNASNNVAVGCESLTLATGADNTAIGYRVGYTGAAGLTSGTNNILIGYETANAFTSSESSNIIIGNAGVVGDANTIRIGVHGNGTGQQYKTYIASCYSNYGSFNTFVGEQAGNTTFTTANAINNTAVGNLALNLLVGAGALQGLSNTALGSTSLSSLTNGSNNTCVGNFSGGLITTGNWNCIIGNNSGSDYTSSESSNIILGSSLGTVGESNVMRLGGGTGSGIAQQNKCFISGINGVTASSPVMVTIDSATDQLGVAAIPSSSITITGDSGGGLTGNSFTFTGGTTGLTFAGSGTTETLGGTLAIANGGTNATSMATSTGIVKYDGTRLVTSSTAKIDSSNRQTNSSQPAFWAQNTSVRSNVTGDGTLYQMIFDTAAFDQNSNYNTSTGVFTAPVSGKYFFSAQISGEGTGFTYWEIALQATGINVIGQTMSNAAQGDSNFTIVVINTLIAMSANDTVYVTAQAAGGAGTKTGSVYGAARAFTWFTGYLVC